MSYRAEAVQQVSRPLDQRLTNLARLEPNKVSVRLAYNDNSGCIVEIVINSHDVFRIACYTCLARIGIMQKDEFAEDLLKEISELFLFLFRRPDWANVKLAFYGKSHRRRAVDIRIEREGHGKIYKLN